MAVRILNPIAGAATVVCLLAASASGQTVLVDHQPHPYGGGASDTSFRLFNGQPYSQREADDFTLANSYEASMLVFWGFYQDDNPPSTETMRLRIYGSRAADGLPDDNNILSETTIQNPSRVWTGGFIGVGIIPHEYIYHANLAAPVSLNASTQYWLEVAQVGDPTTHFRWEDSVTDRDGFAYINPATVDWRSSLPNGNYGTAFQLFSPEPASAALLATGLLYLARRHRSTREGSE